MSLCERHCSTVEPAVHNFRDPGHRLAAHRAGQMNVIHIRSVKFDIFCDILLCFFRQFSSASDAFQVTAFAAPDRDRSTPVSVSGDRPVVDVFQPVSESLFTDEIREPVYAVVIGNQFVFQLGHFNVPAWFRVVDQRCTASPAVRVVMFHLFLGVDLVFCSQPLDDLYVQAVFHNESALPRSLGVFTLFIYRVHDRQIVASSCLVVVFTECRSRVYDTSTIFDGYVVCACYEESFLVRLDERHQLFVFHVFQVFSLHFLQHFVAAFSQDFVSEDLCNIKDLAFFISGNHLYFDIVDLRSYCQGYVGCQRPRSRRPCQEVFVSVFSLEFGCDGRYFDFFISLCYFVGSQSRSAARAVRQDLVSFVDHACLEEFLDDPPEGFYVVVVQRDVWMIQVDEVSHPLGHVAPHAFVREYGFSALFVEFFDTVFFDVLFAGHAQLFFDFDFYRKSVSIPACFSRNFITLHGLVAAHGVLQRSGDHVMDTRLAVSRWRSFIKDEWRHTLSCADTFSQQIFFFPFLSLLFLKLSDGLF